MRTRHAAALVGLVLSLPVSQAWAQVVNGDFETGSLAPFVIDDSNCGTVANGSITDWDGGGTEVSYAFNGNCNIGWAEVTQTVTTVPGAQYLLSVDVTDYAGNPANGVSLALGSSTAPVSCTVTNAYSTCSHSFTAASASEALRILYQNEDGSGTIWLDNVRLTLSAQPPNPGATVQRVPTLSHLALLGLAFMLGGLGAVRAIGRRT